MQKEVLFVLFSATFHSGDRVSVASNTQKGQAGRKSSWERQQEERERGGGGQGQSGFRPDSSLPGLQWDGQAQVTEPLG